MHFKCSYFVSDQGSRLKGESNLQTAADLIFMEKKAPPKSKNEPKPPKSEQKKAEPGPKKVEPEKQEPRFNLVRPSKAAPPAEQKPVPKPVSKPAPPTEDFPSLGATGSKISANFIPAKKDLNMNNPSWNGKSAASNPSAPAAKAAPPPGFQSSASTAKKPAPPPGFKSAGGAARAGPMRYQEPPNFSGRNQNLLSTIMSLIGGKSLEFDRFKALSSRFRSGALSSNEYHAECIELIDNDTFEKFLPQLIALLPDIQKQKVGWHRTQRPFIYAKNFECFESE